MSHIGFYDLAVGAEIYPPIISFFSGGGDGVVEHVGGGAGRAEAREAHCQPHTGDPVQEGSLTGHCQIAIDSEWLCPKKLKNFGLAAHFLFFFFSENLEKDNFVSFSARIYFSFSPFCWPALFHAGLAPAICGFVYTPLNSAVPPEKLFFNLDQPLFKKTLFSFN